jgi:DNA anti-recombination protein RmuC
MRNRLLAVLSVGGLLFSSSMMFAQATQSAAPAKPAAMTDQEMETLRADIRDERKKLTAANMTLSAEEAAKFWPIYDQYIQETIKINDERWSLIKDYAANFNNMTDQVAQDYMTRSADADQRLVALRSKYVPIFQKAVSSKTTAQWYQVDRRLETMIQLQQAALIPIVQKK